jgi:hypothetical protein
MKSLCFNKLIAAKIVLSQENSPSAYYVGWLASRGCLYAVRKRKSLATAGDQPSFHSGLVTVLTDLPQLINAGTVTVINLVNFVLPYLKTSITQWKLNGSCFHLSEQDHPPEVHLSPYSEG